MARSGSSHLVIAEQLHLPGMTTVYDICEVEKLLKETGVKVFVGTDEAGRGSLAGPVVAAAVYLGEDFDGDGIRDSKELSAKQRERLYRRIRREAKCFSIQRIESGDIDRINIRQASLLAMKKAVEAVARKLRKEYKLVPDMIIIDGRDKLDIKFPQQAVVKGDKRSVSIAAAGILAKVHRDAIMKNFDKKYPLYKFSENMGYGTPDHLKTLHSVGCSPIHRKSYQPVAEAHARFVKKASWIDIQGLTSEEK